MEEMELDLRDILNIIYKQRLLILILLGCACNCCLGGQ